ncbi:MAG: sensor histidine kinase [Bacteroidia bacterium]
MNVLNIYTQIINTGIRDQHNETTFADKLKNRNKLSLLCVISSLVYFIFFLNEKLFVPFAGISIAISLFILSILMNHIRKYTISGLLIILNTNYCVLFFSLYLGFNSGIHLYLLTSPLIVLCAFDSKHSRAIILAMLSYFVNFLIIITVGLKFQYSYLRVEPEKLNILYGFNFTFAIILLVALSYYFSLNNRRFTRLLISKNNELAKENKIRKEAEEKAADALRERELLLSEIHHRVKNNLAVISGLLEIHTFNLQDTGVLKVVKQCQNRIKSIAILHEKLYSDKYLKEISIHDYLYQLIEHIDTSFSAAEQEIVYKTNIQSIFLDMNKAMPFGLLINELIINSYKHAFKNKTTGTITISLKKTGKLHEFEYHDNGTGFKYLPDPTRVSLGLTLIETFSQQLNGDFVFFNTPQGMKFKLSFL